MLLIGVNICKILVHVLIKDMVNQEHHKKGLYVSYFILVLQMVLAVIQVVVAAW